MRARGAAAGPPSIPIGIPVSGDFMEDVPGRDSDSALSHELFEVVSVGDDGLGEDLLNAAFTAFGAEELEPFGVELACFDDAGPKCVAPISCRDLGTLVVVEPSLGAFLFGE